MSNLIFAIVVSMNSYMRIALINETCDVFALNSSIFTIPMSKCFLPLTVAIIIPFLGLSSSKSSVAPKKCPFNNPSGQLLELSQLDLSFPPFKGTISISV